MFGASVAWEERVIPFWVLLVRSEFQFLHLVVADLYASLIAALVQYRLDAQPFAGFRGADHVHHSLEANQWFSFPVHADEREHPVLDLVPLACPRRIVAHDNL